MNICKDRAFELLQRISFERIAGTEKELECANILKEECEKVRKKYDEIKDQDYTLSVSSYVEAEDIRETVDIVKLNAEIAEIVAREHVLRDAIDKIIAEIEVHK